MNKILPLKLSTLIFSFFLFAAPAFSQDYILLGWNDLGMHCANKDFSKMAVLPPFNNIHAQLIKRVPNAFPQVVTAGYFIEYSIPGNTYSVGKTNFWTYAQQLFNLPAPLTPNIGLTGHGLTGQMDTSGNFFEITGIPITPFQDNDLINEQPYQTIHLVAKAVGSNDTLAFTDVVIPVSNEINCVSSGCHNTEQNILNEHETVTGFSTTGPNLCASCHASNALGTPGNPEAGIFSLRIHEQHKDMLPLNDINTCYRCHPGPNTQCFRDTMRHSLTNPMICQDCHGNLAVVASSIESGRRPWLDEPRCGNTACHGSNYSEQPNTLFRMSKGHAGLTCSACHGSPHAILPTVQPNDNIQNIRLQGFAGTLQNCLVCHTSPPVGPGPHGIIYLPVELTSFTASVETHHIVLNWNTATELNNLGFDIECSDNNLDWTKVTFISGHGNSNAIRNYSYTDYSQSKAGKYYYRLKQIDNNGTFNYSQVVEITLMAPSLFTLSQNYPNPFNPNTKIEYTLPFDSKVILEIYTPSGQKIAQLVDNYQSAGYYSVDFTSANIKGNFSSGVYYYRLNALDKNGNINYSAVKKMIHLK